MKKVFTIICVVLMSLGLVRAEVLLTEHFNQDSETLATNSNSNSSIAGLDWTNITGSGQVYMNSMDLIYAGYKSATDNTKSIEYKSTYGKKVAKAFKSKSSGSIFTAAIINVTSCGGTSPARDYLWALSDVLSGSVGTASNHYSRLFVQKSDTKFQFGISKVNESPAYISFTEELAFGQYLVVLEYEFVAEDKNDVVRLYVNPVKGDKPTATIECKQSAQNINGDEVGSGSKDDPAQLQAIVLNSSSTGKWACLIDELKTTTKWSELWEESDEEKVPEIQVEAGVAFGSVVKGEPIVKEVTVKGNNLTGNIYVVSDNAAVVPSASVIGKDYAESGGVTLNITLTPTEGDGSAKVTLSSEGAENKEIAVSWYGISAVANIAALKACDVYNPVILRSEPVVTNFIDGVAIIQDASGAVPIADFGTDGYATLEVGDKLANLILGMMDEDGNVNYDFPAAFLNGAIEVKSSDNELVALEVGLDDVAKFGPAFIRVNGVSFTDSDKDVFAAGYFAVLQNAGTGRIKVNEGSDLIEEAIPATADIQGNLIWATGTIEIRSKEDVFNRISRTPTAADHLQNDGKALKVVRNGQVVILRNGKEFNLLGTEL